MYMLYASLLLPLPQALQLQCLKVLAFSTTSFYLTQSWMLFVQLLILVILKSSFISFIHLVFGLPPSTVDFGFQLYNFLTILSLVIWCT